MSCDGRKGKGVEPLAVAVEARRDFATQATETSPCGAEHPDTANPVRDRGRSSRHMAAPLVFLSKDATNGRSR
jgi:hypothetical protein